MAKQQVLSVSHYADKYETEENAASEGHYGALQIARTSDNLSTKFRLVWNYYTKHRKTLAYFKSAF